MINVKNLKIGDSVRLPIYPNRELHDGKIIYIQPGRFFRVEFVTEDGCVIRESYPFNGPMIP